MDWVTQELYTVRFHSTAEIRPYENPRALQGRTVFNRYLGNG